MAGRPRKGSPEHVDIAMRRGDAMRMRRDGYSYPEIALALGYRTYRAAMQDVSRGLVEFVGEPSEELRALAVARLDAGLVRLAEMETKVVEVRDRRHITVNNGRVITIPDPDNPGGPEIQLLDDEPILRATALLVAIEGRRLDIATRLAKLKGLDAPTKVAVITDEQLDAELAKERAALADLERAAADEDADAEGDPPPEA